MFQDKGTNQIGQKKHYPPVWYMLKKSYFSRQYYNRNTAITDSYFTFLVLTFRPANLSFGLCSSLSGKTSDSKQTSFIITLSLTHDEETHTNFINWNEKSKEKLNAWNSHLIQNSNHTGLECANSSRDREKKE